MIVNSIINLNKKGILVVDLKCGSVLAMGYDIISYECSYGTC